MENTTETLENAYQRAVDRANTNWQPVCLYHCLVDGYTVSPIRSHEHYRGVCPADTLIAIVAPQVTA